MRRRIETAIVLAAAVAHAAGGAEPIRVVRVAEPAGAARVGIDTYFTGTVMLCDAAASEGHPQGWEWYVAPPGEPLPSLPTAVTSSHVLTLDACGDWTVGLRTLYAHTVDGAQYVSPPFADPPATVVLPVRSVEASLDGPAAPVPEDQSFVLDGSASVLGGLDPAQVVSWSLSPSGTLPCGSSLTCTISAFALAPGPYTATLTLDDPDCAGSDSASVDFEVVAGDPVADFTWTQDATNEPGVIRFTGSVTGGSGSLMSALWDYGDGNSQSIPCLAGLACLTPTHTYMQATVYTVGLTVYTTDGAAVTDDRVRVLAAGSLDIFYDDFECGSTANWSAPIP